MAWIYDFGLEHDAGGELPDAAGRMFQDAFTRAWHGDAENDGYNRLVLGANLTWREISVLRAVARYLRQTGTTFSDRYLEDALIAHPPITAMLIELFHARLDPARAEEGAEAQVVARIEADIDAVEGLDEDRILRQFLAVTRAILRTNYYQGPRAEAVHLVQARPGAPALAAAAAPAVRDLRLLTARRGRASARWQGRSRRAALVGPPRGLPHRGPRADEGADGEERGDRAGRREGRVLRQAPAARRTAATRCSRRSSPATRRSSAACSTSPTTSSAARSSRLRTSCATTATTHTSWSRPTRGPRPSRTSRTRSRTRRASGSATRSPPAARPATTTRRWGSPPAARGSRSRGTSASSATTSPSRTSRSSASGTCRATCSATGCCSRRTSA